MTDRELLERAAKAADLTALFDMYGWDEIGDGAFLDANEPPTVWNPLTDDGDALRLAVAVGADISINGGHTWADIRNGLALVKVPHGNDPCAATRRAIVMAAADLEK